MEGTREDKLAKLRMQKAEFEGLEEIDAKLNKELEQYENSERI